VSEPHGLQDTLLLSTAAELIAYLFGVGRKFPHICIVWSVKAEEKQDTVFPNTEATQPFFSC
jgi:hypothetical protein